MPPYMKTRNRSLILIACIFSLLATSCTGYWHRIWGDTSRQGVSSSLVDFLYPNGETPPDVDQTIPTLQLPLRVGLAFVPARTNNVEGLSEANKNALLEKVKASFASREFIKEITIIPDTYLRSGNGFQTVDQLARLYSLDVIALVSYDQVAHVDDTASSILYWTIVGAYFIEGSKNDVQSFVDTAVFDVKTHKLLFRAPGINKIEATSTLVGSTEKMRKSREESFSLAMENMTSNLNSELDAFKEKIKKDKSVVITRRSGYTGGGGALDFSLLALFFGIMAAKWAVGSKKRDA